MEHERILIFNRMLIDLTCHPSRCVCVCGCVCVCVSPLPLVSSRPILFASSSSSSISLLRMVSNLGHFRSVVFPFCFTADFIKHSSAAAETNTQKRVQGYFISHLFIYFLSFWLVQHTACTVHKSINARRDLLKIIFFCFSPTDTLDFACHKGVKA